jgi:hypothetical protein
MAGIRKKVKLSLDEARLLVLGAQILLGFQYRAFLEPAFSRLPVLSQDMRLASLGLMLATMLMLMWPISFHEIVEDGDLTPRLLHFATLVTGMALLPFALALGIDIYTVGQKLGGYQVGIVTGSVSAIVAIFFWYGWEYAARPRRTEADNMRTAEYERTSLDEKIDTVLTECRVVIPGAQALLGFQLIAVLMEGFDRLARSSQYIHLASLLLITLSAIFLMAPAAYHRIVEHGEDTARLWHFARAMLLAAMATLAAGVAGESYVVIRQVTHTVIGSIWSAGAILVIFYALWFGYTAYKRFGTTKNRAHHATSGQ